MSVKSNEPQHKNTSEQTQIEPQIKVERIEDVLARMSFQMTMPLATKETLSAAIQVYDLRQSYIALQDAKEQEKKN